MIDVNKKDFVAKILIIGETKVGKSSILTRFTENYFTEHLMPTLGHKKLISSLKIFLIIKVLIIR